MVFPSGEIKLGGQEHFYMETQSMLVVPVGEEAEFNLYVSTQWPTLTQVLHLFTLSAAKKRDVKESFKCFNLMFFLQDAVAETLGVPSNRITCHVKRMGGAFGGKVTKTSILASITAVAAWKFVLKHRKIKYLIRQSYRQ